MSGRLLASICCLAILVGCDSSAPTVTTSDASPSATTAPGTPNPHGMPPSGSPHGMSPMGSPHGTPPMGDPHGMGGMSMMGGVAQDAPELGMVVQNGPIYLKAPEGWVRKRPASQFTMAQFGIPAVEGDKQDGKLTISVVGGGAQANVQRWRGQYPGGDEPTEIEVAGRKIIMVDFTAEPDSRMLGAVIPTGMPGRDCYVKLIGPKKTLGANTDKFKAFIQSLGDAPGAPAKGGESPAAPPAAGSDDSGESAPDGSAEAPPAETPADAAKEASEDGAKASPEDAAKETPADAAKETPEDAVKATPEETPADKASGDEAAETPAPESAETTE